MGNTMSGKTSLVRAIRLGQPFLTCEEDRTIGVEETKILFSETVEWKVQDCGGQRSYMLTNQLMVSESALVLIVVDVKWYEATEERFYEAIGRYLEILYERNSKAHVIIVMSKVDGWWDRRRMKRKQCVHHINTCVSRFVNARQSHISGLRKSPETIATSRDAERVRFLLSQSITMHKGPVLTSAKTLNGVGDLRRLLGTLSEDSDLLPTITEQLPASWVAIEDHLVDEASPILDIVDVVDVSFQCGLEKESTLNLLRYLHNVGSLLFFSRHPALRDVVFSSTSFVIDVFKAVFRHDHDRLCYDHKRFGGEGISRPQFEEMRRELVENATVGIPMLRAMCNAIPKLNVRRHLEIFVKMFLSFDFAYLVTSSDDVAQRISQAFGELGLVVCENSAGDLQPVVDRSRTVSSDLAEASESRQQLEEETELERNLISILQHHHVGLLLPWLLRDEEPPEVKQFWTQCSRTDRVEVSVEYSFTCNVPVGLFERLSARCHRHSQFIHHWRSGLLLRYGPVTLLFRCDRKPSCASMTLRGRVVRSKNSRVRLWHVLLRCVVDLEDLISTIPGVLVDGFVRDDDERRSPSSAHGSSHCGIFLKFVPGTSWVPPKTSDYLKYSEHQEAIEEVHSSLKESVPLHKMLSRFSGTLVREHLFSDIAKDIGSSWIQMALKTCRDHSIVSKIRGRFPDSKDTSLAAFEFLNRWFQSRNGTVMVCELYDILCDVGLSELAQREFRGQMMPDGASDFLETMPVARMSAPVSKDLIGIVADVGRDKWRQIGIELGLEHRELCDYDRREHSSKVILHRILSEWTRKDSDCTLEKLLEVCRKVGIQGEVTRRLEAMSREVNC
jgi:hypothetical protein